MSSPGANDDCDDCTKVRLEQELIAEEARRASERDIAKLDKQHDLELAKLRQEHANALDSAEDAAVTAAQQAELQADAALEKLFHEKLSEVAVGAIERSRDGAKYVQTAAAAVAALYTGALALVFSVTEYPLPVRGIAATVFLGLSVALATAYLAYLSEPAKQAMYSGGSSLAALELNRTDFLTKWVNAVINDRRWALRASVISLAIGVAFIPAAFVATRRPATVPPAPTVPAIPAVVAPALAPQAEKLVAVEVENYEAAVKTREAKLHASVQETNTRSHEERIANELTLLLGIFGFAIVVVGPLAQGDLEIASKQPKR